MRMPRSVEDIRAARRAESTVRTYRKNWLQFVAFCESRNESALPASPRTIAEYLAHFAQRGRASTAKSHLVAICAAHVDADQPSPWHTPVVNDVLAGLFVLDRDLPPARPDALPLDLIERLLAAMPRGSRLALRDRALVLLGFAGALRISELRNLLVSDLVWLPGGRLVVRLRYTKTGPQQRVPLVLADEPALCAMRALRRWLAVAGVRGDEPVFCELRDDVPLRHRRVGLNRLRAAWGRYVAAAGLPPGRYTFHSLRAGLVTTLARAGFAEHTIMRITRHRTHTQVRGYIRDADLFRAHPLDKLF